jgi:putative transposase
VKLYPFIAAEQPAVRNVKKTCTLLCVSRSAFYQSRRSEPSLHEQRDIVLEERIVAIHEQSRRT